MPRFLFLSKKIAKSDKNAGFVTVLEFFSVYVGVVCIICQLNSIRFLWMRWYYEVKKKRGIIIMEELIEFESVFEEKAGKNVENSVKLDNNGIIMLPVEEIMPNRAQPRRVFDNSALVELSESVKKYGVIQPIVVRRCDDVQGSVFKYELVAGERRLRAVKMAGMAEIPCVLVCVGEEMSAELAIIENLHRKNLNIFETAAAICSLIEVYGCTQEDVARKLSITQSAVANKLRLLRLSEAEKGVIIAHDLTERHARCLLKVQDEVIRWDVLMKLRRRYVV